MASENCAELRRVAQNCAELRRTENHLTGSRILPPSESTIRASVGVISGRSVTSCGGSSLSLKQYIWSVISSPPLRLNSAVFSRTGASYSWKANERATERNCAKSQLRTRISSGKKSRVPDGGSNEIGIRSCLTSGMPALFFVSPDFVTPAAL